MTRRANIIRDEKICGGEPIIAGTRIPVRSVVILWRRYDDPERVRRAFPRLDPGAIQAALDYYGQHTAEIDAAIAEQERAAYGAD